MQRNHLKWKAVMIIALAFLIGAAAPGAKRIFFFVSDPGKAVYDLNAAVPADALFFKGNTVTPYTDSVYYQFDSDNGYDFYCHFILADLHSLLKLYMVDYKLHCPDGTYKVFGGRFDKKDGIMAADRFEWKMGPNSIKGDQKEQQMHIESGPVQVDVTLKTVVPFYRPGENGLMTVEPERKSNGIYTYFPMFEVKGTIKDRDKTIPISGWGYGNRLSSEAPINNMTSLHTALRWQKEGLGFDFHDYLATPEYGGNVFGVLMIYNQGRMIHVAQNYVKEKIEDVTEPKTGAKIPASYRITSKGPGVEVKIEYTQVKLSDYNDPLVWMGDIEKKLYRLISEPPLDLRFDGQVKITVTTDQGTITREGPGHGLALVSK